jgi:hypothetical protein
MAWDAERARSTIAQIVADTEARFDEDRYWPPHPRDVEGGDEPARGATPLYHGACGVFWALHYLQALGAARLTRNYLLHLDTLLARNQAALAPRERASYLMGDTPIRLMAFAATGSEEHARMLDALIAGNVEHPSRELMWGAPGTMLAALFLHERTGDARWAELFRLSAATLWRQLEWSPRLECTYWTQQLYGWQSTYLGTGHGFVATALPLIRGRHLLSGEAWAAWERCIVNTVRRTAVHVGNAVNWPPELEREGYAQKNLMQICHGSPGFVVGLAALPSTDLDALLVAAGEGIWSAGPLTKGSNLCHGTGGNGYAFLALYRRTRDPRWLERARAFAMHGIMQTHDDAARYGQMQYSLWTGDPGFAIYLWDCLRGGAQYPTLDVFYA